MATLRNTLNEAILMHVLSTLHSLSRASGLALVQGGVAELQRKASLGRTNDLPQTQTRSFLATSTLPLPSIIHTTALQYTEYNQTTPNNITMSTTALQSFPDWLAQAFPPGTKISDVECSNLIGAWRVATAKSRQDDLARETKTRCTPDTEWYCALTTALLQCVSTGFVKIARKDVEERNLFYVRRPESAEDRPAGQGLRPCDKVVEVEW